jgi:hypothetical protein
LFIAATLTSCKKGAAILTNQSKPDKDIRVVIKTFLIFLLVTLISPYINGQSPADTLFTITYKPAFHNSSKLAIYKDQHSSKGLFQTITVINGKAKIDTTIATVPEKNYSSYLTFFSTYKFPDTTNNYVQGVDGITIIGTYYGANTKRLFRFWSPYHDKESMALFKMTLNDLNRYFKTSNNKQYLKWLKMYSK